MTSPLSIALIGAGLIGQRHANLIDASDEMQLAAIVDPSDAARQLADDRGTPWYARMEELFDRHQPDGVIIATPNQLHRAHALAAVSAGIPVLIEKPIADTVNAAAEIVAAGDAAGVPILVGHHRRHNPLIAQAKVRIEAGDLGQLVAAHASFWILKPDAYFEVDWRRQPGAGPVFINLIHDIDLMRHLCGEIVEVTAIESNTIRGNPVEDTAAALLRFANGAIGTVTASDTITAPWSWEQTAGENPAYPKTEETAYMIGGTHGSLSIPRLELWRHPGPRGWWEPIEATRDSVAEADPLIRQLAHFARVIRGEEPPLVSGTEGLATLRVVAAIKRSAQSRTPIATL
ncbi:MAG: Gfo/Idh/MocA family oxidoreductase [Pseudomonadota bacterium]